MDANGSYVYNSSESAWNDTLDEDVAYDDGHEPSYYSYKYRVVGTFFQGVILLVGVLGNAMVVAVVLRTRSMRSPTNCYLVSLALADCVVLVASVPNEILSYYLLGQQWIWGKAGCALFIFLQNLGINASSLSLTAFTVERYFAICKPMRAHTMCTVRRAKRIIFFVWLFSLAYCSPWLGLTTTKPLIYKGLGELEHCTFKLKRDLYLGYFFADLLVFYVGPLILSCVLYGLIARILFNASCTSVKPKRLLCRFTRSGDKNSTNVSNGGGADAKCDPRPAEITLDSSKTARAQVVKMLAVVVAIFATLWLPYRSMLVYNSFAAMFDKETFMDLWFLMFAKTCIFINSAINPILYNVMSVKFNRAFRRMLVCNERGESSAATYYAGAADRGSVACGTSIYRGYPRNTGQTRVETTWFVNTDETEVDEMALDAKSPCHQRKSDIVVVKSTQF